MLRTLFWSAYQWLLAVGFHWQCPSQPCPAQLCDVAAQFQWVHFSQLNFKDPGPTNLALLKCRGGQTQPRLLTHISIQATNLTSCLFDMIKHETSRADVKSWRSLSFNTLLMLKSWNTPTLRTTRRGLGQSKLICKVGGLLSVQMSTLRTFKLVVRNTLGKYRKH